ncbi:SGNH/GDSL hydrolase family protein, partial [Arthrobacter sp. PsM3]|uniref:SGNH/GDSL hydrolase family protein n=1 Tax=Arthrobacter sp. PsM3 TaxID=3030531 RepID=UPI00263A7166
NATFVPKWKANTAYLAGAQVLAPTGEIVSSKVSFTSGSSFSAANWNFPTTAATVIDFPAPRKLSTSSPVLSVQISNQGGDGADNSLPHNATAGTYYEFGAKTAAAYKPWFSHGGTPTLNDYFGAPAILPSIDYPDLGVFQVCTRFVTTSLWLLFRANFAGTGAWDAVAQIKINGVNLWDTPRDIGPGLTPQGKAGALHIAFRDNTPKTVEIFTNVNRILSLNWDSASTTAAWPLDAGTKRVVVAGDSWNNGTTQAGTISSYARALQTRAPWEVLHVGQGGTGYVSGGMNTGPNNFRAYGDPLRITAYTESLPDLIVMVGSQNDYGKAGIQAAATALAAAVKTASTNTKILLIGAQASYATDVSAALKATATANPSNNIIGFVDPIADGWIVPGLTGPTDTNHPSPAGAEYMAYKIEKAIRAATSAAGLLGW